MIERPLPPFFSHCSQGRKGLWDRDFTLSHERGRVAAGRDYHTSSNLRSYPILVSLTHSFLRFGLAPGMLFTKRNDLHVYLKVGCVALPPPRRVEPREETAHSQEPIKWAPAIAKFGQRRCLAQPPRPPNPDRTDSLTVKNCPFPIKFKTRDLILLT